MESNADYTNDKINFLKEECKYYSSMIDKTISSIEIEKILNSNFKTNRYASSIRKFIKIISEYMDNKNLYDIDNLNGYTLDKLMEIKPYLKSVLQACRKLLELSKKDSIPGFKIYENMAVALIEKLDLERLVCDENTYCNNLKIYGEPLKSIRNYFLSRSSYAKKTNRNSTSTENLFLTSYYQNIIISCEEIAKLKTLFTEMTSFSDEDSFYLK